MSKVFWLLSKTSIKNVLSSGNISEVDTIDASTLLRARDNDELGDYLGYTDFEQARVFNEPYSLAELLMIVELGNARCDHMEYFGVTQWILDTFFDCSSVFETGALGGTFDRRVNYSAKRQMMINLIEMLRIKDKLPVIF